MSTHHVERTTAPYGAPGNTITIRSGVETDDLCDVFDEIEYDAKERVGNQGQVVRGRDALVVFTADGDIVTYRAVEDRVEERAGDPDVVWLVKALKAHGYSGRFDFAVPDLATGQSVCDDMFARCGTTVEVVEDWRNLNVPEAPTEQWVRYVSENGGEPYAQTVFTTVLNRTGSWFPDQSPISAPTKENDRA